MISMKRWGLILLSMLCSELAAEPPADVRTWTPQQKLALLSGISDKETADTAAELINSDSTFFFTSRDLFVLYLFPFRSISSASKHLPHGALFFKEEEG